jgi:DNA-binding CsgD family transcriptional regulator
MRRIISLTRTVGKNGEADLVGLSPRERDTLRLVMQGKRPPDIAADLGLTEHTARAYIFSLCQGLGLGGRHELAIWGMQNPKALVGRPAHAGLHPEGCRCEGPLCAVLNYYADEPAAALAT